VLLQLTRGADDLQRRVDMVRALTDLVVLMRQHVRKFLPDLLALVNDFWGTAPTMLPHILSLLAELSRELGRRRGCPVLGLLGPGASSPFHLSHAS
jgi:FKBP12-rapamycin complex-associated protein